MSEKITIYQLGNSIFSNQELAIALSNTSCFGELKNGKVIYSIYEAIYLAEKGKARLAGRKDNKKITKTKHTKEYLVFKDLRDKGFILKEGLKFGSDFRVYDKSKKPGKDHAKYLLYIVESKKKLSLSDFSAKARIAHTTNKSLLLALIDSEEDINYYEVGWKNIL